MAVAVEFPPELHRFTHDEYWRMVESGGLDEDAHVELLDGLIVDMSPKSPGHEDAIMWLARVLITSTDAQRFGVRVGSPLSMAMSAPEPDLAVVEEGTPKPYHPGSAALVIEVAVSSLRRDLRVKPRLYAQAGVARYWVVDLDGGRAVVHADPVGDAYTLVETLGAGGVLRAPELGLPGISVADVLAAAAARR